MCPVAQHRKHLGSLYSWGEMGGGRKAIAWGREKERKKLNALNVSSSVLNWAWK